MTNKYSAGCACCVDDAPCCVQAKRHFMDTAGHANINVSSGPSGGPYNTFRADELACVGFTAMDTTVFPAWDLSPTISADINRNAIHCGYDAYNEIPDPGGASRNVWEVGAGRITEKICSVSPFIQLQYLGLVWIKDGSLSAGPAVDIVGRVNYYCDSGDYHYELRVTVTSRYRFQNLSYTFPTADPGVDWTSELINSGGFTTGVRYNRNSGGAKVEAFFGFGYLTFISSAWITDTATVNIWTPNPLIDPLGLTEAGQATIT